MVMSSAREKRVSDSAGATVGEGIGKGKGTYRKWSNLVKKKAAMRTTYVAIPAQKLTIRIYRRKGACPQLDSIHFPMVRKSKILTTDLSGLSSTKPAVTRFHILEAPKVAIGSRAKALTNGVPTTCGWARKVASARSTARRRVKRGMEARREGAGGAGAGAWGGGRRCG